jgi:hypothetical protein
MNSKLKALVEELKTSGKSPLKQIKELVFLQDAAWNAGDMTAFGELGEEVTAMAKADPELSKLIPDDLKAHPRFFNHNNVRSGSLPDIDLDE